MRSIERAACGVVIFAWLVGCASPPAPEGAGEYALDRTQSRSSVLTRALAIAINDAVRHQASQFGRVPQLSGQGDEIDRLVAELSLRYPELLRTTPGEERRLTEGRIDYAARMNELRLIERRVEREGIRLPIVSAYLLDQFSQGQLAGVRLELAARLLRAQVDDPELSPRRT